MSEQTISIMRERIIQEAKRLFIHTMKEVNLLLTTLVLKIKHILVRSVKNGTGFSPKVSTKRNVIKFHDLCIF